MVRSDFNRLRMISRSSVTYSMSSSEMLFEAAIRSFKSISRQSPRHELTTFTIHSYNNGGRNRVPNTIDPSIFIIQYSIFMFLQSVGHFHQRSEELPCVEARPPAECVESCALIQREQADCAGEGEMVAELGQRS